MNDETRLNRESYVLPTGHAGERRYRLLHAVHGLATRRLCDELRIRPGMQVADIGCGIGLVTVELAERVGPTGRVTGMDMSDEQLSLARRAVASRGQAHVGFLKGNVYSPGLARDAFDLVYCRSLLSHLERPERAMRELSALVRPGGLLACEDIDMGTIDSAPRTAAYDRLRALLLELGRARNTDYQVGAHLPALFRAAGFAEPQHRVDRPAFRAGDEKRYWEFTFQELIPGLREAGVAGQEELEKLAADLARCSADASLLIVQAHMHQVWARRPAS